MKVKYYNSGEVINTFSVDTSKKENSTYHLEIIEALNTSLISSGSRRFILNPSDIIISPHYKEVSIISKTTKSKNVRWFSIELVYPAPLNQYLIANNALIHDLMNDKNKDLEYVVFRNLNLGLCHNYLNNLEIIAKQPKSDQYFEFQAQRIIGLLFTELLHNHRKKIAKSISSFPSTNVKYASRDSKSGALMTYIAQKNGNVTLQEVANHFGYQKNYLSRLCKTLFDLDFIHLRLNIRMNLATEQLSLTTKSIDEISFELGYKETSTFIQNFIKAKKITPSNYRKIQQEKLKTETAHPDDP